MANYANLKSAIQQVIKTNGNNEITGALLQQSLLAMINSLGGYYQFAGIATPLTNPGTPDQNVFYIGGAGTYSNFSSLVIPNGYIGVLKYSGTWTLETAQVGDINAVKFVEQALTDAQKAQARTNIGAASSGQVSQLEHEVDKVAIPLLYDDGYIRLNESIGTVISLTKTSNQSFKCYYADCEAGDTIVINGTGGSAPRLYGFIDIDNKLLEVASGGESYTNEKKIAPTGSKHIIINDSSSRTSYYIKKGTVYERVNVLESKEEENEEIIHTLVSEVSENSAKADTNFDIISGKLIFEQGAIANSGENNDDYHPEKTIRMPSAVQAVAKSFYVPTEYYIAEVYYYSAWTSPSSFTLAEKVVPTPQTNIYTIDPTIGAYYRFSIKRIDDGDITPAEIYQGLNFKNEAQAEFNRINGVLDETIKKTPQSLNDDEKSVARLNIGAAKANYRAEDKNGLVYVGGSGKAVNSDVNVLDTRNIFDVSNAKAGYRLDDSGNEVSDSSEVYTTSFIPALGGLSIIGNVAIGKVYCFRQDFSLIKRESGVAANVVKDINAAYDNETVYWIAFQIKKADYLSAMISTVPLGGTPTLPGQSVIFSLKQGPCPVPAKSLVWEDNYGNFELLTEAASPSEIANSVLFSDISPWEPATADSGYSNPTSGYGKDTKRADWSAADKYYYYEFLAHYYDTYLGVYNNGDYKVTKKGLWQDGAHTGHEIFEYDFCPKDYRYVVMLSAGMNADETQGIWGLATFIRALMREEETNMAIMKRNIRFKVIPIINASGFDEATLRYTYFNGVNPNFNFNYIDSWAQHDVPTSQKGDYPDSNYETVMLKKWINGYSGKAVLWLDLHTGRWNGEYPNTKILDVRFSSISAYYSEFNTSVVPLIKAFYQAKGTIVSTDDIGGATTVRNNLDYQKHRYALDVCGINSAMPEMHIESTGYGADGFTNNSVDGIKCYVLQIRQIIMYVVNKYIIDQVSTYNLPKLDIMMFRD